MVGTLSAIQTNEVIGLDDSTSSCQLISNTHHRRMTNPQSFGDPAVAEFRRFPDLRSYDLSFCHRSQLPSRQVEGPDQRPFFLLTGSLMDQIRQLIIQLYSNFLTLPDCRY